MKNSLPALAQNIGDAVESPEALIKEEEDVRQTKLARLESLVAASPIAMFTCRAGGDFAATFVTEGVRALWGYEPEDFVSQPAFWPERIHPEDVAGAYDHLNQVLRRGTQRYDCRFRAKNGDYRWSHHELRLVRDGAGNPLEIAGYSFDITEQKLAEAALRESEARQKAIFNATTDLQVLFRAGLGDTFVIEAMNRAMTENLRSHTDRNAADFIGRECGDLMRLSGLSKEEAEGRRALCRQARDERRLVRYVSPSAGPRDALEVSIYPVLDEQANCTHLLVNGHHIAERIKAEAGRRESEERRVLVTEAIQEGISDWNLVTGSYYLSPRYKEILGFRDDELPSHPDSFFGRVHPDQRAWLQERVERYGGDPARERFEDELRLRHKDGTYRYVVWRGRIVRDDRGKPIRVVAAIGDVTDRLESAAKLAASEKRLRDILDSLFGFVGLFSLDGRLLDCNRSTLAEARYQPEKLIGQLYWEMPEWSSPQDRAKVRETMLRAAQGELVRLEAALEHGGHRMIIDITMGPLRDQQGAVCNVILHSMDITAQKKFEAELIHAKEAAESASRAKSDFLANVSHEVRTPMNGVIGLTELLLGTTLDAKQREYLTLVQRSAEALLTIINDILDVSKIEAGKLLLDIQEFDLREVVFETAEGLKAPASAKGLSLSCNVEPDVPARVRGDAGRLRQILINLIGNAIKFTERGGVALTLKAAPDSANFPHFSVRDTGIGIPALKQAVIFEAFTQADGSSTRKFGGTGLGLTIASHLVHMMDGRIWVESQAGKGSTFNFTARLEPAAAGAGDTIGPAGL
jgi:PAS domain S-box-containing protein